MAFFAGNLNIHRALMLILLAAGIGPSLLFMEWAFLWNFKPQQIDIAVYMIYFWTVQHTMKRICLNNLLWNMVRVALKNLPSALGSYNLISYFMHNNVILLSMLLFLHNFFFFFLIFLYQGCAATYQSAITNFIISFFKQLSFLFFFLWSTLVF